MSVPVAYLRRSSSNDSGQLSYSMQESAVLELAARNRDDEPEVLVEWGVSGASASGAFGGTGRGGRRKVWLNLRRRIEAGEVSALYAYSLSRLARSSGELLDLAESCAGNNVAVHLAKEGTLDFSSPHGRLYLTVLAAVATFEAEVASERGRDRTQAARDQGKYIGRPPYGYTFGEDGSLVKDPATFSIVEDVVATMEKLGTYRDTARDLNTRKVLARQGGQWTGESVAKLVLRERGTPVPRNGKGGSRQIATRSLSRLLYCGHCGRMLSPHIVRPQLASGERREYTSWGCLGARVDASHPRPYARAETGILTQLRDEAVRMVVPVERVRLAEDAQREIVALEARRVRLVDALEDGTLTRADVQSRLEAIEAERERLEAITSVVDVPQEVDWSWEPAALNEVLHALWEKVDVDLTTATVEVRWRDPSLRG